MNRGVKMIRELERMYQDAPNEIRERILTRVLEIKSETACGIMIVPYARMK